MHIPPKLRVAHIFLREATLAKYYHKPNYNRFKHLAYHLNYFDLKAMKMQESIRNYISQQQQSQYLLILRKVVEQKVKSEVEAQLNEQKRIKEEEIRKKIA